MLKQLSRLERTRSLIIIVFAVLMGLSLVFFYAPNRNANATPASNREVLAEVNGEDITVGDLAFRRQSFMQRLESFGGQFNRAQLGGDDRRLLDGLIRDRLLAQEAARLGLSPSDAEVADAIRKQFRDPSGKLDVKRYKDQVASQFGDVQRFEQMMRDDLAARKLRAFITAGVRISDTEVQEEFQRQNTSFDLVYVPVAADQLAKSINPSDEELQRYFGEHRDDFRINAQQKRVRYLFIDQAKMGEKIQIPDEELRSFYNELKPENKQAGVRVQQIVLKVASPDLDQQVLAKATELSRKGRDEKTMMMSEEAFADLARGNSEDPATAKQGGWLPGLVKKNPTNPNDLLQATLEMQPGQVGDPVFSQGAYYIFRRGESVVKTFEEARQELLVSARNRKSYAAAAELAARASARLKETKDFASVAAELAADANMSASQMVKETPFVAPGDNVPDIGSSPQFEEAIAPLNNPNDVGDRVSVKGGFAVPMLLEKRDPHIPEFAEVKDKVAERVRQEQATARLEQAARDLAAGANSASDLEAAAKRLGLEAQTLPTYKLGSPLGEAGTSTAADSAIYNLKAGEVTKTPVKIGDNWVVAGVTKRTDADLAEFATQREQLTQSALRTRQDQVFEDWASATRTRFEREGDIKVYEDVFSKAEENEPPSAAPRGLTVPPTGGR